MPSAARAQFLTGVGSFRSSVDESFVFASNDMGLFLRRGLTVAGFNLLETFIVDRLRELASYVNDGHVQFLDLPERLQVRTVRNTLAVAQSRMRRLGGANMSEVRRFSRDIGRSLLAVDANLHLTEMAWLWSGSNIGSEDFKAVLRDFHVGDPWRQVLELNTRIGFALADYRQPLESLARERHSCAHDAAHQVTSAWLRTIPDLVLALGLAFDALCSVAAGRLRRADPSFLGDEQWTSSARVKLRFVRRRSDGFAEEAEGRSKAVRVGADLQEILANAQLRCREDELLVRTDGAGLVVGWSLPNIS